MLVTCDRLLRARARARIRSLPTQCASITGRVTYSRAIHTRNKKLREGSTHACTCTRTRTRTHRSTQRERRSRVTASPSSFVHRVNDAHIMRTRVRACTLRFPFRSCPNTRETRSFTSRAWKNQRNEAKIDGDRRTRASAGSICSTRNVDKPCCLPTYLSPSIFRHTVRL